MLEIDSEDFERLVSEALDHLPSDLAELMDNVAIFVDDASPDEPELLGVYDGVPLTERDSSYLLAVPDRITIFRLPTLAFCADAPEIRRQVQITVVHEIAHHFGIDDGRLNELGYA